MVWEPTVCCCCLSPRVGTLVLGWFCLIWNIFILIGILQSALWGYEGWEEICEKWVREDSHWMSADLCVRSKMTRNIVSAPITTVNVVICILLLVGVHKNKSVLMLPFMIGQVMNFTAVGIIGLLGFGTSLFSGKIALALVFLTFFGLIMFLLVFLFLVVRVCYKEVNQHARGMYAECSLSYVDGEASISNKI